MIFQPVSFRIEKKGRKEPTLQSLGVVARGHTYGQVIPIALFYEGSKAIDDEIIVIIDGYTTDQPLVIPPGQKNASIVFQNSPMLIKKDRRGDWTLSASYKSNKINQSITGHIILEVLVLKHPANRYMLTL